MTTVLRRAIALRPGEGRAVALVAGLFAAVEAGRGLGEVGVDTLVLDTAGAEILPRLYIGLGVAGLVVTLAYGTLLARSSSQRFFPLLLVILAVVLIAEWLLAVTVGAAVYPLVWITVYAMGMLLLTAIWTVGSFVFDARQAKRLFPLLTSAAIVGSLAGFLSAIVLGRYVPIETLILGEALSFLVAAALLGALGSRVRPRPASGMAPPTVLEAVSSGAAYVARSPLMRLVAVAYVLLAVLMFSLTFPFMAQMSRSFPDAEELLTRLALFSAGVTVASFLTGTLLANRVYARFGVAAAAITLPLVYVAGFGIWMVRFSLVTAVTVRFAQQVTQRGISNAAFSAFYNVIPSTQRGQVMAFMDGVPGQVGTVLSGLLLMVAAAASADQARTVDPAAATYPIILLGLATSMLALAVLVRIRRAYASSLVTTLRESRSERVLEGGPGLTALGRDRHLVDELRAATRSERSSERLLAADVLGRIGAREAGSDLRALAGDEEPEVRRAALVSLVDIEGAAAEDIVRPALRDPEPRVRAAAITASGAVAPILLSADDVSALRGDPDPIVRQELVVLCAGGGDRGVAADVAHDLLQGDQAERTAGLDALARVGVRLGLEVPSDALDDPAGSVRAAALRALAALGAADLETLVRGLSDEAREVRLVASAALRERDDAADRMVQVLRADPAVAGEGALAALTGHAAQVRSELLAWSEAQVERATALRRHAQVLARADRASTAAYLGTVIAKRELEIETRLLQALAVLGAPEASGLIRRCLHAPDPEIRAQAIEALDALGDPGLTRGVVSLLEREIEETPTGDAAVIVAATALQDDSDRWVRALALRTLSEHLETSRHDLATRVRADPDELVRTMVEVKEESMPTSHPRPLSSDVDRMLVLRRVPLFQALDPEDLQRVSAGAVERSWMEGEVLMEEGDIGDELVVIVEGRVRVVHRQPGQPEREVRTYGEGDHIGELAVLREAPRAATVVADAGGVRGLSISGAAIQALLRERPEAAMAMLATLAERIGSQGST